MHLLLLQVLLLLLLLFLLLVSVLLSDGTSLLLRHPVKLRYWTIRVPRDLSS